MSFQHYVEEFFLRIIDLTYFMHLAGFSLATVILVWPKEYNRKSVIVLISEFVGVYAATFIVTALGFPIDRFFFTNSGALVFTLSFFVAPVLFIVFFTKGGLVHKALKIAVAVSSMALSIAMSRDLGRLMGYWTNDSFVWVVLARTLPCFLVVPMSYLMKKYDLCKYLNLPNSLVVILFIVSTILFSTTVWEGQTMFADEIAKSMYLLFTVLYLGLMIVSALLYYSIYHVIWSRHQLTVAEVQATLSTAEREAIELDAKNREELSKLRHDLNNQLSYLSRLLDEGKEAEAKKYLADIGAAKQSALDSFSCSNEVVSSIVNLEINKAKLKNISVRAKVVVPPHLMIEDIDLVSLITNIVDNAIENTKPNGSCINLSIITYQDYLRISCSNEIEEDAKDNAKSLHSRKLGKRHGYGTKIIRNIADSYGGYASFSVEGDVFITDVVLMLTDKEGAANA